MNKQELGTKITEVSRTILSYCMARTSNQQDAEDLAQDIICEIMKSMQNIRDDRAFYGFMWSVAGNVYKQWCRKKQRNQECELSENMWGESDFSRTDCIDDIFMLRREMALMKEKYRRATILYYLENKSCAEIAQILSVSESMVKYLLFKSRKILKEGIGMVRNYGEQSYNPKNLNLMYMGEGPNKYWEIINDNKIRQNILWACYNDSLTEEEIALQIGVSLPYIENDIKKLMDVWLLKKEGSRYKTNIIILTEEFEREKAAKILGLQKEIAEKIKIFFKEKEAAIRSVGFCGSDMTQNSLKWHMVTMILLNAYLSAGDKLMKNEKAPVTAFGDHAYLWGVENVKGGFNCCTIRAEEWNTGVSLFFMDWYGRPNVNHHDFYCNVKWVKMYDKIVHGDTQGFNEFEQEIVAEMIRKGYAEVKAGKIIPTMPVYTSPQLESMKELQKEVTAEICAIFQEMHKQGAAILKNHVPSHLKSQVPDIAAMSLFNDGAFGPASILNQNGYLLTEWMPDEIPTSYAVLK